MQHLFVGGGATYGAVIGGGTVANLAAVNTLAAGALALFDANTGALITTGTTWTTYNNGFILAVGSGDATLGARTSIVIPRKVTSNTAKLYTAAVNQVDVVGNDGTGGALNLPASIVPGTAFTIVVVDENVPVNNIVLTKYHYQYVAVAGDTGATVVTNLIAQINADNNRIVNATVIGAQVGILLSAINGNQAFTTLVQDLLSNATVYTGGTSPGTVDVALVYSVGAYSDLLAVYNEYSTTEGNTNQVYLPQLYWSVPNPLVVGTTYDTVDLTFNLVAQNSINTTPATQQTFIVAVVNGSAQSSSIRTIFANAFVPYTN